MKHVQPIKDRETVREAARLLAKHYGDAYRDIFIVGISLGLRVSDLLALKWSDIEADERGLAVRVIEGKTGKVRITRLAADAASIVAKRRAVAESEYIFAMRSRRNRNVPKPLSRSSLAKALKEVGEMPSVGVHLSTHSMRKTFGYLIYMSSGKCIVTAQRALNHDNPKDTIRYLGIGDLVVDNVVSKLDYGFGLTMTSQEEVKELFKKHAKNN